MLSVLLERVYDLMSVLSDAVVMKMQIWLGR